MLSGNLRFLVVLVDVAHRTHDWTLVPVHMLAGASILGSENSVERQVSITMFNFARPFTRIK